MPPFFAHITAEIDIPAPPEAVFAHWHDPNSRLRWEAPEGSGMRYLNFAPEAGGVEEIEITHDGAVVGHMTQRILVLDSPHLSVAQISGTFGGATTMIMQVTMRFDATDTGTRITGTSQVIDTTGRDVKAEHEGGWQHLFTAFAADFAAHGVQHG
ncbi:SRPBCC family protein [Primorskyibacter sp. S187A]|uniref:SRPBCC family protein n=1 Tax=Primorskyibacter sp. S187A TaxID=3415130 RepID=UPI003C7B49B7